MEFLAWFYVVLKIFSNDDRSLHLLSMKTSHLKRGIIIHGLVYINYFFGDFFEFFHKYWVHESKFFFLIFFYVFIQWILFIGCAFSGRDYGMVATSFSSFDTLFKFQFINSKHKLLKFSVYMKNVWNKILVPKFNLGHCYG